MVMSQVAEFVLPLFGVDLSLSRLALSCFGIKRISSADLPCGKGKFGGLQKT